MKKLFLALFVAAAVSVSASDIVYSTTVVKWDPVTTTTDGEPVTIKTYTLGLFLLTLTNVPIITASVAGSQTECGLTNFVTSMGRNVEYELRVMAEDVDTKSPWSLPLPVHRGPKLLPPPGKPNFK